MAHQCGPGLIPCLGVICGLSLLLVLVPALRVFLRVLQFSSLHKNQHFQIPIQPGNSGWKSHLMESTKNSHFFPIPKAIPLNILFLITQPTQAKKSLRLTAFSIFLGASEYTAFCIYVYMCGSKVFKPV